MSASSMKTTCRNCGADLSIGVDDLRYALERIERGDHAACACDDDCAAECGPWDRADLMAAITRLAQEDKTTTMATIERHDAEYEKPTRATAVCARYGIRRAQFGLASVDGWATTTRGLLRVLRRLGATQDMKYLWGLLLINGDGTVAE